MSDEVLLADKRSKSYGKVQVAKDLAVVNVEPCGQEAAETVHAITQAAFKSYEGVLVPPSGVVRESVDTVRQDLRAYGGAIARLAGEPVGCLRFETHLDYITVRRVAVLPERQRSGLGQRLMNWAHDYARSLHLPEARIGVRLKLPRNLAFYEHLGYRIVGERTHPGQRETTWYEMSLKL